MARAAAAVHKKKPQTGLLALLALFWACLQTAQPVRALAGPTVRCSSRPSSSTSSSISTGPHQLRPLRASPRRAVQASEPSENEDDKDKEEQLQKTVQEKEEIKEDRYQQRVDLALKGCARAEKALQIATDELESVTKDLVFAREQRRKAVEDQNQQKQSTWDQNVEKAAKDVDKAKKDVDKAKEDFHKAEERLKEEEAKVSAAPAQAAGGVQLLLWLLVCSIPHGRRAFRAFLFFGVMLCSSKDQLVVKFHCVGLQHFGEWEGLLAASGSGKPGYSSCFADASERGVSPRLEVAVVFV
eukprot:s11661_g1.t1